MSKTISQAEYTHNYDDLTAKMELYDELKKCLNDIAADRTYTKEEFFVMLDKKFKEYDSK